MKEENITYNRLKEVRNKHRLSQAELAKMVGMKQSMVNRIENQQANLTVKNAIEICRNLNESLDDLFVETHQDPTGLNTRESDLHFDFLKMLTFWQLQALGDGIQNEILRRAQEQDEDDDKIEEDGEI